jgi:hypothetical protein
MKFLNHNLMNPAQSRQLRVEPSQQFSGNHKAMTNCAKLALCSALLGIGLVAMNKPASATDEIASFKSYGEVVTSALYLSVREGSMMPGKDLIGWTNTSGSSLVAGGPEQRWSRFLFLTDQVTTDDWYGTPEWNIARLRNQKSGLCITTDGVAGHPLTQQICDPKNPLQLWTWRQNDTHSGYGYKNPSTNLWIDLEGASYNKGTRVIAWYDQGGADNQQWQTGIWSDGISNSKYLINDSDPYIHYTTVDVLYDLFSDDPTARQQGYDSLYYQAQHPSTFSWNYSPGRPSSFHDYQNDLHYTTLNNNAVYYTFNGTGISYISEVSDGYGKVDVLLDGIYQTTVDANASGVHNKGGQILYKITGLPRGSHNISLLKRDGAYMLLDGFEVYP